jgi:hypothetical protein
MTFVRKNTAGSTAGHTWEAGEVKDVHSLLADELTALAPDDFEIIPSHKLPVEVASENSAEENSDEENAEENSGIEEPPAKAKRATKKSNTETPSAE